jgi:outer membrane protein assembly factor BamB
MPTLNILQSRAQLAFGLTFLISLWVATASAQVSVLTQHNNNSRTGANMNETFLKQANVNVSTFGKLFGMPVDGLVFAQPLYLPEVNLPNSGTHNVVFVATAHDSVYAFDADTGAQLWRRSLGTAVPSSVIVTPNILIEVGIISTPVIDPSTFTLYVVTKTYENSVQIFRLHALDILKDGAEKLGGPRLIAAQYNGSAVPNDGAGHVQFVAAKENQRAALTLVHGVIYMAFASHEDYTPYHGWVLAYSAANLQQLATYNTTPNGGDGGIWMSGQGLVADSNNNIYCITGNSAQDTEKSVADYGESFLKLGLSGNALTVIDFFKAHNYDSLNHDDVDLGSGGPMAIPGTTYIVGGGKQGLLYLVNTNDMGKFQPTRDRVVQEFQADKGLWGAPVFWNNPYAPTLYVWGVNDSLKSFRYNFASGMFNTPYATASSVKTPAGEDPCGALSISSNQSLAGSGIVWATIPLADPDHGTVHGKLCAFDATNVGKELWDSDQNAFRDDYGYFAKFVPPTVANGKVYIATDSYQVYAYGLNPPAPAWHHTDISVLANAPAAAGDPSGYVLLSEEFVVYRGTDNHVHQLFSRAGEAQWSRADLTAIAHAPLAVGNPSGYVVNASQRVVYRGTDDDIHVLYSFNNGTQWAHVDLSTSIGAPPAAGDPFGFSGSQQHVDYKGADGHIHQLSTVSSGHWVHSDLTALAKAPLSASEPFEYSRGGTDQEVPFRGVDGAIHQLYTINNDTQWAEVNISAIVGAPAAASNVTAYFFGDQVMNYRGSENHIHELFVSGTRWIQADLTNLVGAPVATGDPFGYAFGAKKVVYKGTNNDIHQLYTINNDTKWADSDLSLLASAPPSAGDPFVYIFGNQAVVYRGIDGNIHLLHP